jgi:DnaJ-domain-containing protein 1
MPGGIMSGRDPKGHYAALGIDPAAGADEIKRAYRRLAKALHPDQNKDTAAAAQFQRLSEAYQVLSNAELRSAYDAESFETVSAAAQRQFEPISCSKCGKVTAQPRYAVYWTVVSLLIATWRTPTQGIFCAACGRSAGLRASFLSGLLGWWGAWGLIWTPLSIFHNANGGERPAGSEARLLWYNAIAFLSQGHANMAYALARKVASSDSNLAGEAADLMAELHRAGVRKDAPGLVDVWKQHLPNVIPHLAMGAAAPLIVAALMFADASGGASVRYPATPEYPSAMPAVVADTASSSTGAEYPPAGDLSDAPALPTCENLPEDGQIIDGALPTIDYGHKLEVKNGSGGPAIVKLRDATTRRLIAAFYIRANQTAEISPIEDGVYRVQFGFGDELGQDCKSFNHITSASEFPNAEALQKEVRIDGIVTRRLSFTLYSVPNGNVHPENVPASAFEAG